MNAAIGNDRAVGDGKVCAPAGSGASCPCHAKPETESKTHLHGVAWQIVYGADLSTKITTSASIQSISSTRANCSNMFITLKGHGPKGGGGA